MPGPFYDGTRPITAAEQREYDETVASLGGPNSQAGKAFIESEHKKFKEARLAYLRKHGGFIRWLFS